MLSAFPSWPDLRGPFPNWHPVNYMEKDGVSTSEKLISFSALSTPSSLQFSEYYTASSPVDDDAHIYFKSAYVAMTKPKYLSESLLVNRELVSLQPSKRVMAILHAMDTNVLSKAYGVHIRSRTLSKDNVPLNYNCEYTISGAALTNFWRLQSQLPMFLEQMRLINKTRGETVKFFVAADDVKILDTLEAEFPGRILSIPRNCDDRHESCVVYALADMISLSKTSVIYGSNWSSFTEAAGRLGNMTVYLSGVHFGLTPRRRRFQRGMYGILEDASEMMRRRLSGAINHFYPPHPDNFTNCIR